MDNWKEDYYKRYGARLFLYDPKAETYTTVGEEVRVLIEQLLVEKDKEFVEDMMKNLDLIDRLSPPKERTTKLREYISYKYSPSPESKTEEDVRNI